jgi:hypothetical protein
MKRSSRLLAVVFVAAAVAAGLVVVQQRGATSNDTGPTLVAAPGPADPVPAADRRLAAWPGVGGDPARDEQVYAVEYAARERLIQACMRARGFTYRPIPLLSMASAAPPADPNRVTVERLSAPERQAYDMALAGVPDANDPGVSFDPETGGGCLGEAHRSLPGIFRLPGELENAVAETRAEAAVAPEVVRAAATWRACLTEAVPGLARAGGLEGPGDLREALDLGTITGPARDAAVQEDQRCRAVYDRAFSQAIVTAEEAFVLRHADALESHRAALVRDHQRLDLPVTAIAG